MAASGSGGGGAGGGGGAATASCTVQSGLDALSPCGAPAASDLVQLIPKWSHHVGGDDYAEIANVPLVANLTDDNGDGAIDLCDTPDVLVQVSHDDPLDIELWVLSGKDGSLENVIAPGNLTVASPAIVDLDRDGVPEILATNSDGHVMALSPTGTVLWEGTAEVFDPAGWYDLDPPIEKRLRSRYVTYSAVSVADLDGDESPEILVGMSVLDAHGGLRFQDPTQGAELGSLSNFAPVRPIAADLDGDGKLEVLFGHVGYRADGSELYRLDTTPGYSQVGDFFGDGRFEVLVTSAEGLTLVSSTGDVLWGPVRPPDDAPPVVPGSWVRPAAVVDMDGDGLPEALVNCGDRRMVLRIGVSGPTVLASVASPPADPPDFWMALVGGSTAFDFRGSGPDWLAFDSLRLTLFDGMGPNVLGELGNSSGNGTFFPVVADVDDDGSADVILVHPSSMRDVTVYEDAAHRPSPARRIWNQWAYAAGAVREDAKLAPAVVPSAKATFRVQSRRACVPAD